MFQQNLRLLSLLVLVGVLFVGSSAMARKPRCYEPRESSGTTTYYYVPSTPRTVYYERPTTYYRSTYTYESEITIRTRISYSSTYYSSGRSSFYFD